MQRYTIRRVALRPLLRFGLVLGGLLGLPFGCLLALITAKAIPFLRRVLEDLQQVEFTFLKQTIHLDFVSRLNLNDFLQTLQALDGRLTLVILLTLLSVMLGAGLVAALLIGLLGQGYNVIASLSGGIELQLARAEPGPAIPGSHTESAGGADQAEQARAWLIPARPDAAGLSHPLCGEVTSIGSGGYNAIVLASPGIAGRHAEIRQEGDRYVLYDLGSTHGSYVNGRRTQVNLLKDGWTVRFGDEEFIFRQV